MKFYPSYLPLPQVDYSFSNDNRTVRNSFESGRISQRSIATKQRDIINVVFQFDFFQLGVWESFVQTSLSNGALEFKINLPDSISQTVAETTVLLLEGKYNAVALAGSLLWKVTATLVKQNKTSHTQEQLDLLELTYGNYDSILDDSDELHTFVHETLPEIIT